MPFRVNDDWLAFPNKRASEFARFVGLAKGGRPFEGAMMIGGSGPQPAEYQAALNQQQKVDLERSFAYMAKRLWPQGRKSRRCWYDPSRGFHAASPLCS